MNMIKKWWSDDNHKLTVLTIVYALMPCIKWLQTVLSDKPHSNNFLIFRQSFFHLLHQQPLYIEYPSEHWDYFFYNPVFAFLFAPFALLPENVGFFLCLVFLTFVFFKVSRMMPFREGFLWLFLLLAIPEFSKNLGHLQPNILNCSLMLLTFLSLEKKQNALAGFLCAALFCIKGYGVIVGAMCFFYPKPWKTIAYGSFFLIGLSALPLSITPFSSLIRHYTDWLTIVSSETILEPFCLMGFAERTLHWTHSETSIMGFGLLMAACCWGILLYRLLYHRAVLTMENRAVFLGFLLIWVVSFNRAAESPTYLYAVVGALILYHFGEPNRVWKIVFGLCFYVLTIVPSDLSPPFLKALDQQYFLRPVFTLPLLFYAFFYQIKRINVY